MAGGTGGGAAGPDVGRMAIHAPGPAQACSAPPPGQRGTARSSSTFRVPIQEDPGHLRFPRRDLRRSDSPPALKPLHSGGDLIDHGDPGRRTRAGHDCRLVRGSPSPTQDRLTEREDLGLHRGGPDLRTCARKVFPHPAACRLAVFTRTQTAPWSSRTEQRTVIRRPAGPSPT